MANTSDNAITFSFDTPGGNVPSEEVLQAEFAGATGEAAKATPSATATPAPAADDTPAPDTKEGDEAQSTSTEEPRTYKVKVNGQELVVTEKDLLDGHMRLKDYTQKTQRLADMQRDWETTVKGQVETRATQLEQELASIDQFLQNREAIEAYMQKAFGGGQAPQLPQVAADQPLTAKQVADIARYNAEQVRTSTIQQMQQEMNRRETLAVKERAEAAQRVRIESDINAHINTILDKFPGLRKYDGIEDELMADAAKRLALKGSTDVEEAKQLLGEAAERKIAWAKAISADDKKQAAVASAKLTRNGIEPPGGTGVRPQTPRKLSLDTKDRSALIEENIKEMEAWMKARG